jgi:hypothetical protein
MLYDNMRNAGGLARLILVPMFTLIVGCTQMNDEEINKAIMAIGAYKGHSGTVSVDPPVFHAELLLRGDFRGDANSSYTVPYHLYAMISYGKQSGPTLVDLLTCQKTTPYRIVGGALAVIMGGGMTPNDPQLDREATVADLAEFALRHIFDDLNEREPYKVDAARIEYWRKIVTERNDIHYEIRDKIRKSP